MMKKRIVIWGSMAVLAIAAAYPFLVGIKAEKDLRKEHEILAQEVVFPGLKITLDSYKRGYLGSEAVTGITITPEAKDAKPIHLELHHHISHLPNPLHLALASATSELVLPPEIQAQSSKILNGNPPLTIESYIRISGSQLAVISSPAFKTTLADKDTTIEWKGLEGIGTASRNSQKITNDVTIPGIVLTAPDGGFAMHDMHYKSDMKRGSHNLWYGTSEASLGSLQINARQPDEKVTFNDLRMTSEQKEAGPVTNGNIVLQFGKSNVDDVALESGVYDFEYRNFDTKALSDIQKSMRQAYAGSDDAMVGAAILSSVPSLLKTKPEINIRRFEFKSSLGNVNAKFHLAFTGDWKDEMMANPVALLPMLDADLDFTITKSLMVAIARSQLRSSVASMAELQGEKLSNEEIEARASERAAQKLELLVANEFLLDKGDLYTTKIHFEKGQLTINGTVAKGLLSPATQ